MGNCLCFSTGTPLAACGWTDWCVGSFVAPIPICIWRTLRFLWWLLVQFITLIVVIFQIIWVLIADILTLSMWLLLAGIICWAWWYLFPNLAPYVRDIAIPLINVALELAVFAINIFQIFWNLFAQVWNALCPLIGMLIYIFLDLFLTVLHNVVVLLGEIDVYALFRPLMEILEVLTEILVEIIQALISAAVSALKVLATVIGAILQVVFKVVDILFPIMAWLLEKAFQVIAPILELLLSVISFVESIWGSNRSLLAVGGGSRFDTLHQRMYSRVQASGKRYWSNQNYARAQRMELDHINAYNQRHPAQSFEYYYTVHRPVLRSHLQHMRSPEFFAGIPVTSTGGRQLLSLAVERKLLSKEDAALLHDTEHVSHNEYWKRFDSSPHDHLEWYKQQHYEREQRKQEILHEVQRKLLALKRDVQNRNTSLPVLDEIPDPEDGADFLLTGGVKRDAKHPFSDELHRKVKCKSKTCGGEGVALPHPVHRMREMSWSRRAQPFDESSAWKNPKHTDAEHQRSRFIHLTAWSQALLVGKDRFMRHMQNPLLHKHVRDAWNRTTGFDTVHDAYEAFSDLYPDSYHLMHDYVGDLTESIGFFRWLKKHDPERLDRPYYSDWYKAQQMRETTSPQTGRRVLEFVFDNQTQQDTYVARSLLSLDPEEELFQQQLSRRLFQTYYSYGYQGYSNYSASLPFHPNPIPDSDSVNADLEDRNDRINAQRPHPDASLPLFDLLTKTDCYTTIPRNPLCLPKFPASWQIATTPQITWPSNFTLPQDCSYLYEIISRDPKQFGVQMFISEDWLYNSIESIRIILSIFTVFTSTLGLFIERWPWAGWLFKWLLALPPGAKLTESVWFCFVEFGPYSLWLLVFLTYLAARIVFPLLVWLSGVVVSWTAFYATFVLADQAYHERLARTSHIFYKAAYDSEMNPGVRYYNDPDYFKRGWDGRRPTYYRPPGPNDIRLQGDQRQFSSYQEAATQHAQSAGRYYRSSMMPYQGQTPFERFNSMSPYVQNEERNGWVLAHEPYDVPAPPPTVQASSAPIVPLPATAPAAASLQQSALPQPAPPPPPHPSALDQESLEMAQRRLDALRAELLLMNQEFGLPESWLASFFRRRSAAAWITSLLERAAGSSVRRDQVRDFEYRFNPLLQSFQYSIWWMTQYSAYVRERARVSTFYSPVYWTYQRGFTAVTRDDIDNRPLDSTDEEDDVSRGGAPQQLNPSGTAVHIV